MAFVTVTKGELESLRKELDTYKVGLTKAKDELNKIRSKFGTSASIGRDMHDRWIIEKNCNDALSGKIRELRLEIESKDAELLWAREALAEERAKGRMPPRKRANRRITVVEVPHVFEQGVGNDDNEGGDGGTDERDERDEGDGREELVWLLSKANTRADDDAVGKKPARATTPPSQYSFMPSGGRNAAKSGAAEGVKARLFP